MDNVGNIFCIKCDGITDDTGCFPFRTCSHLACLPCLTEAATLADLRTIRCFTNPTSGPLLCKGFLNLDDLEWVIPPKVFEAYQDRVKSLKPSPNVVQAEVIQPSNSVATPVIKETEDDDPSTQSYTSTELTFNELALTPEELKSGWGQIASAIVEMQSSGMSFEDASLQMDIIPLWNTTCHPVQCPICFDSITGFDQGVILKGCFHIFCRGCLTQHITHCENSEIQCPFREDDYICNSMLKPKEVENLVPRPVYLRHYEELSLVEAEKVSPDAFHCLTPNCTGFCFIEDHDGAGALFFECPKCGGRNCTACKEMHMGSCESYKRKILEEERRLKELKFDQSNRVVQLENNRLSEAMINMNVNQRNFMRCPRCKIPCYKFTGCNHVICGSCKLKFDWSGNEPNQFH